MTFKRERSVDPETEGNIEKIQEARAQVMEEEAGHRKETNKRAVSYRPYSFRWRVRSFCPCSSRCSGRWTTRE